MDQLTCGRASEKKGRVVLEMVFRLRLRLQDIQLSIEPTLPTRIVKNYAEVLSHSKKGLANVHLLAMLSKDLFRICL